MDFYLTGKSYFKIKLKYIKSMLYKGYLFQRSCSVISTVKKDAYPLESYNVVTNDGYILTMHRIRKDKTPVKPPVLLQHGLWSSSEDWIIPGPGFSLGYLLADSGYDVWLGNSRGNNFSRRHVKLDPDKNSKEYWDFSWHEMGYQDLPAMIEKILSLSTHKNLYYIGHSQGATVFFVMGSTRPEMNQYIKRMYAFAPVAYLKNMKSPFLHHLASMSQPLFDILSATGYYKLMPNDALTSMLKKFLATNSDRIQTVVPSLLHNLSSYASDDVKKKFTDVILAHIKSGASFKSLEHFAQCAKHEACFRHFDYGLEKNMKIYGQATPPSYNLKNISTPLYFFYSDYDWLTGTKDIEMLFETIPNKGDLVKVNVPQFNHLDFIWASNAKDIIYNNIVKNMNENQNEKKEDFQITTLTNRIPTNSDQIDPLIKKP